MTRRSFPPDPQVRYALKEANLAFVARDKRTGTTFADVILFALGAVMVLVYVLRA